MKNVLISLAAIAALSTAALASDRSYRSDSDTSFGNTTKSYSSANSATNALVIAKSGKNLTAFERMNMISEENEYGHDSNNSGNQSAK